MYRWHIIIKKRNYNAATHSTMRSCIQIVMLLYITEDHKKHRVADKGCQISWKTKTSLERWYCGATGNSMDKDSKGQRKLKDSGGGLLAAVKGRSLQQKTEYNTRLRLWQTELQRTGPPRWPSSMVCTWRAGNMRFRHPSPPPPHLPAVPSGPGGGHGVQTPSPSPPSCCPQLPRWGTWGSDPLALPLPTFLLSPVAQQ